MCPEMLDNVNDASPVDGGVRMWGMANNQCLLLAVVELPARAGARQHCVAKAFEYCLEFGPRDI